MHVRTTEGLPLKLWLDDIEDGALKQAGNLAKLPFAFRHIAIMPDAHQGYGMPIGGVMATQGVVVPNAVGVDIGCGCLQGHRCGYGEPARPCGYRRHTETAWRDKGVTIKNL